MDKINYIKVNGTTYQIGGSDQVSGSINVTLESYINNTKSDGVDLEGATITVTDTTDNVTAATNTWHGATLTFSELTPLHNYSISVGAVSGYTSPAAQTVTNLGIGATTTKVFAYYGKSYSVIITDNQNGADIASAKVTYNSTDYSDGDAIRVSNSTTISTSDITTSNISGYKKTVSIVNEVITVTYETELVTVTVGTDETGVTAQGQVITINGSNYTVGASGIVSAKVPYDTIYSISANAWSGVDTYDTPATQSNITANASSRSITMTYLKQRGTLYSLVVNDNQDGDSNAATNATVTIKYTLNNTETVLGTNYKNGDTFLIPTGAVNITLTGSDISGFAPNVTVNGTTYTVLYRACSIMININGNSGGETVALINSTKNITVKSGRTDFNGFIPWGDSWEIKANASSTRYPSNISKSSGTANSFADSLIVTYSTYNLITSGDVDLGLPSGNIWSAVNVGASSYTDEGLYFSWGNVDGHAKYSGYNFNLTNYNSSTGFNLNTSFTSGDATYDAARANMGGSWRMPTTTEFLELVNSSNTSSFYIVINSVKGRVFISKLNSNAIFFPTTGYSANRGLLSTDECSYWTASINNTSQAKTMIFTSAFIDFGCYSRYTGMPVRAVKNAEAVDLGLSSGVKWATCNLGANSPEEAGLYFSWGDTTGHAAGSGYSFDLTNYNNGVSGSGHNLSASFTSGDSTYDAARAILGGSWRIPTLEEIEDMIELCTFTLTSLNGVAGIEVTGTNGATIFLPCAGWYGDTTLNNTNYCYFWVGCMPDTIYSDAFSCNDTTPYLSSKRRTYGLPIRPVC